ncbi:prokineticin-1 isoform X1 [Narcine bancroftii]|uniref:prokineticin-1 isoform X1 n=1 Tax=Narcine bancroftii TaxID=1343680 RepID=UPI0038312E7A
MPTAARWPAAGDPRATRPIYVHFVIRPLSEPTAAVCRGGLVQACERDVQCGPGSCCAVSLWLRGLRMCTPRGQEGDKCHPFSHKVPFPGKRQHHTCPCMPHLSCSRSADASFQCTSHFKHLEFQ